MKAIGQFCCAVAGMALGAGPGCGGAASGSTIPAGRLVAPASSGLDSAARIAFPPGARPVLRLRNGEIHQLHSLLNVTKPLAFGEYVWNSKGIVTGRVWVRIDLAKQLLSVFRGDDEIGTAVIIFGTRGHPTPVGIFPVLEKSAFYYSRAYGAPMPYALRLTSDGVALHASSVRERAATHGCVGLPLEFAHKLYDVISRGDLVEILPDRSVA